MLDDPRGEHLPRNNLANDRTLFTYLYIIICCAKLIFIYLFILISTPNEEGRGREGGSDSSALNNIINCTMVKYERWTMVWVHVYSSKTKNIGMMDCIALDYNVISSKHQVVI